MRSKTLWLLALLVTTPTWAQKDLVRTGSALAPTINASENTVVLFTGAIPPSYVGALDADDSTYNRPLNCTALSGVGTAVPFDTLMITNNASSTANLTVFSSLVGGAPCGDPNDTFFTLYNGAFNPASPLTNCVAVNDDISGAANRCSTLSFSLPAGQTRTIAIAGFNNAATANGLFSYQINFSLPIPVELMEYRIEGELRESPFDRRPTVHRLTVWRPGRRIALNRP